MKKLICLSFLLIAMGIIPSKSAIAKSSMYKITATIDLGGEGHWDYSYAEPVTGRLYVSHGDRVHVIDMKTNKIIGEIGGLNGVHGIAICVESGRGFISEGGSNSVAMFDIKTNKVIKEIQTIGKKPDAIVFEPLTKRVFAFCGGSADATAIDAKTGDVAGSVKLGGNPEFAQSDKAGKMFVNLEEESEVNEFDPKTMKMNSTWSLAPCGTPTGMAIDIRNKRLFIGGRNKLMAVVNYETGKVIKTLPIGDGVDAAAFDESNHLIFFSCKEGVITVVKQNSADSYEVVENILTEKGAKTMTLDPITNKIYTSTILTGAGGKKSFGVIVIEPVK